MASFNKRSIRRGNKKITKRHRRIMRGGGPFDSLFVKNPDGTLKMELLPEHQANVIVGLSLAIVGGGTLILQKGILPSLPEEAIVIINALATIVRSIFGLAGKGLSNLFSIAKNNIITTTAINILSGIIMSLNALATTQVTVGSVFGLGAAGYGINKIYGDDIADYVKLNLTEATNLIQTRYTDFVGDHPDLQTALNDKFIILLKDLATVILYSLNNAANAGINIGTTTGSFLAQLPRVVYNNLASFIPVPSTCPTSPILRQSPRSPPSPPTKPSGITPPTPTPPKCSSIFQTLADINDLDIQNGALQDLIGIAALDSMQQAAANSIQQTVNGIDEAIRGRYEANLKSFNANMMEVEPALSRLKSLEGDVRRKGQNPYQADEAMASQPVNESPLWNPESKKTKYNEMGGRRRSRRRTKHRKSKMSKKNRKYRK